jgi:putative DNA methylase
MRPDPIDDYGWYDRGYLPHLDRPGIAQLLSFRQADSVPRRLLLAYDRVLAEARGAERRAARTRTLVHMEQYLAKGRGTCRLRDPAAAKLVEDALLFHAPRDYDLIAWVVMPNHVHVVLRRKRNVELRTIVRRWKSWTAARLNEAGATSGRFWQPEVFDSWLRDEDGFSSAIRYVEMNPVKAGLCRSPLDWPFGSARRFPRRWSADER